MRIAGGCFYLQAELWLSPINVYCSQWWLVSHGQGVADEDQRLWAIWDAYCVLHARQRMYPGTCTMLPAKQPVTLGCTWRVASAVADYGMSFTGAVIHNSLVLLLLHLE